MIRVMADYVAPYKGAFAADMILSVVVAAIDLIFPLVSRKSMQTLLPDNAFGAFFAVMAIMLAAYALKAVFSYLVIVIGHNMGLKVETDMRNDAFGRLQQLPFSYYDKNRTGTLLARVTTDLFEMAELIHHGPENILTCTLTIAGAIAIMLSVNLRLGLVLLVILPISVWFMLWSRKKMQTANIHVKQRTGIINSAIESSISGIRTAKAYANEDIEMHKFREANEVYRSGKREYYLWMGVFNGGMEAIIGIIQVIVIALGGYLIMCGRMDYIDLITFTLYVSTFTTPIRKIAMLMEILSAGTAGYSRFVDIMTTEPDIKDAPDASELSNVVGHVSYENVCFSYDNGKQVLKDINIDIKPGQKFALVGSSGGGKTTMCHLLPRFYDVTEGRITIDGTDIRTVTQKSLRENIGLIQQDVFLFAGTVIDNIRYGRPDATDEEVIEAAKRAQIHDEIMQMPDGYETFVGERGIILSGGQKQRISIARVFLKNPPIIILDEATSALDSVTESAIQASLDELSIGKTTVVIAHRLSTIRNADNIAVVDGSCIVEQGSREELLKRNGVYAGLEKAQEL